MTQHPCPICTKRACDSIKTLHIYKLSRSNEKDADIVIKCHNCKSLLAVMVDRDTTIKANSKRDVSPNIALST